MGETKPFWESRTLWVNGLTVIAMILAFLIDAQSANGLPFDLDARWIALALGIVNIILRSVTSQPVSRSRQG